MIVDVMDDWVLPFVQVDPLTVHPASPTAGVTVIDQEVPDGRPLSVNEIPYVNVFWV
jgi:hypothetical protein